MSTQRLQQIRHRPSLAITSHDRNGRQRPFSKAAKGSIKATNGYATLDRKMEEVYAMRLIRTFSVLTGAGL